MKIQNLFLTMGVCLLLSSCISMEERLKARSAYFYQELQIGKFSGKLIVEWIGPDLFRFIPDPNHPFMFTRWNGEQITVNQSFITNGGSIPRLLWSIKNYSPWSYGSAYVMHDWLYQQHRCTSTTYSFMDSAQILAEMIKTLMESGVVVEKDDLVLYSIYLAVLTPIAEQSWNMSCSRELVSIVEPDRKKEEPILYRYTIEFER